MRKTTTSSYSMTGMRKRGPARRIGEMLLRRPSARHESGTSRVFGCAARWVIAHLKGR